MKNSSTRLLILRSALLLGMLIDTPSFAETNASKAKRSLQTIRTEVKVLKKLINKSGVRKGLASQYASLRELKDSDDDGLPDIIENVGGSNSCKHDSDDDGISDGDEDRSGSSPTNPGSSEVELTGLITNLTETTVTVGDYTFTVTEKTEFRDGGSLSSYRLGDKVEVSGRKSGGILVLRKIKTED